MPCAAPVMIATRSRRRTGARSLPRAPLRARARPPAPRSRSCAAAAAPRRVDEYLAELDRLIAAHDYFKQDKVIPAIGRGAASREVVQRLALEFYYLGKWMTPEFALLVANAPDAYAFTMDASQHYHHWAQNLADEAGYLRDPNHVQMKVAFCHQLGLG